MKPWDFIRDVIGQAMENAFNVVVKWGDNVLFIFLNFFPFSPQLLLVNLLDEFQELWNGLVSAVELAVVEVLARSFPSDKWMNGRTMKVSDVFDLVVRTLTTDAYAVVSLRTPWSLSLANFISGNEGRIGDAVSGRYKELALKSFKKLFSLSILRVILFIMKVLFAVVRQFGMVICIAVLGDFLYRVNKDPEGVFDKMLGQRAPRRRVRVTEPSENEGRRVIRRRMLGGVEP